MSFGILGNYPLGAVAESAADLNAKYPWHVFSQDTLDLQIATNQALQAAGYCPVPVSGVLDGSLCGARALLTNHSREFFGVDMLFAKPPACNDPAHDSELSLPAAGCFKPTPLKPGQPIGSKLTKDEWILIGGAVSILVAGVIAFKGGAKRA
ncbi:MAG TPA: hypothetical protein VHQ87_05120 [Rhizobacter sp.]|nr:hypothetical protein [Rhizobacter sp.]